MAAEPQRRTGLDAEIAVYELQQLGGSPVPEFADLWPHLHPVLLHQFAFNGEEAAVREQQQAIIRDRSFLVPSPFGNAAETCDSSYYFHHRFFYQFTTGPEEFLWVTAAHDRGYVLTTMYFPERRAAVSIYPAPFRAGTLEEFEEMRAGMAKPPGGVPVVVIGFPHPIHMFWNEFSALEYAAQAEFGSRMRLAALFEPFGPTGALFPEFAAGLIFVTFDYIAALNRDHRLLVGLGGWTIPKRLQHRLHRFARRCVSPLLIAARDAFRAKHAPVFWFSVKADKRTFLDQADILARLIAGVRREYAAAGFILDGTSFPWDFRTNPNYVPRFLENLEAATQGTARIIDDLLSRLDPEARQAVQVVSGVPVLEEIVWGEAADFYFAHAGTMAPKIGWIHRVPGLIHSSSPMRSRLRSLPTPVEDSPPYYFLSEGLEQDCPTEDTGFETVDANYAFTDVEAVLRELLAAFRSSSGSAASVRTE